jgi:ERCC4-related helicase
MPTVKYNLKDFKPRLYQETIVEKATKDNTLVVLPTGLGKTAIALMLALHRLNKYPDKKVVILAPTRPLVSQHLEAFRKNSDIPEDEMIVLTGQIQPAKRKELFKEKRVIFSTPQGLENDMISKRIDISKITLLVVDEAHRTVGDYSYVLFAKHYNKVQNNLILALTASPGSEKEKIEEVCRNLQIEHIERRTKESQDVSPYVHKTETLFVEVVLDDRFKEMLKIVRKCLVAKINEIKQNGFLKDKIATRISKKDILQLQGALRGELNNQNYDSAVLSSLSLAAQVMKVMHAVELLETQGLKPLQMYLDDLFEKAKTTKVKATIALAQNPAIRILKQRVEENIDYEHPKLIKLKSIILAKIKKTPSAKIIIFNQYRDSITNIVNSLNKIDGIHAKEFVGQAKKRGSGLSQKEQLARIQEFANNEFNVIVMSSVGEEGLDIPEVDVVIFYEPIPSAIRSIQRRGRTGRHAEGQVIMLVAKGTRDEAYKWSAYHKERKVNEIIAGMNKPSIKKQDKSQSSLETFNDPLVTIFVDVREKTKGVISELLDLGVNVKIERLSAADYLLSTEIGVEFKTIEDFVDSIIDGRLLEQLPKLKEAFPSPLIVVQGDQDIFSVRNIHPNAIYGMLSTIALSFRVPILYTKNAKETSNLFLNIAKREQTGKSHEFNPIATKPTTTREQQEFLVGSLPGVGITLARKLLTHFGSIEEVIKAPIQELKKIEKIGHIKAKKIRSFIEEKYS